MFTKVYWLEESDHGSAVGIMPRPRGDDWLEDEVRKLASNGVQTIVSLLESHETTELGLKNEESLCQRYNLDFISYPIPDRELPKDQSTVNQLIAALRVRTGHGEKIVIHCRMGIGRSSMIAAAVLINGQAKVDEILDRISNVRGLIVPDTEDQIEWLRQFER